MDENELKKILADFETIISNTQLTTKKRINFFSVTKMLSLETKHSALLAWLLDPENEHCLKNSVLQKLMGRLFSYKTQNTKKPAGFIGNSVILGDDRKGTEIKICDIQQAIDIADKSRVRVYTERQTLNKKRIDILIDIVDNETVIVIENKIDSSTHDEQLLEYQNYVLNDKYTSYKKKIFIYLTKFGDYPKNLDGSYNSQWCMLDYCEISGIIKEVLDELKNNSKKKIYSIDSQEQQNLIHILGDYKEMIDTSILNTSVAARKECEKFLANPKVQEAMAIIDAYRKIPTPEQIADYACRRLGGTREGTSSRFWFYTPPMKKYYEDKNNEEYKIAKLRIVCQENSGEEAKIVIYLNTERHGTTPFSPAQSKLLKSCLGTDSGTSPTLIKSITLVEKNERGKEFDLLKGDLDSRIDAFKKELDIFIAKYL